MSLMSDKPRVLIVYARYYPEITDELLKGAVSALDNAGAEVRMIKVPGAFEIPHAVGLADFFAETAAGIKYHGYVSLGCVIRGETSHYDYVCGESARKLMDLSTDRKLAIGYGILTCENEAQALARARMSEGDKGGDAARTCLEMIALRQNMRMGQY